MRRPLESSMKAGIEQIGAPAEVYERPATILAGFVGVSNVLERAAGSSPSVREKAPDCTYAKPLKASWVAIRGRRSTSACSPGTRAARLRRRSQLSGRTSRRPRRRHSSQGAGGAPRVGGPGTPSRSNEGGQE